MSSSLSTRSKYWALFSLSLMYFSCLTHAEFIVDGPGHQVTDGRTTISLNGQWKFATDVKNNGVSLGFKNEKFNDKKWDTIDVPGSWSLYDNYANYVGDAWYRRTVNKPSYTDDERVLLRFEAAYYDTDVWFNGHFLGNHKGGYTPFEFDVTELLQQTNTIAVRNDNTYSVGAWYYWGGLTRDVSLIVDSAVRIVRQKFVAEPDLISGQAHIKTEVTIENMSKTDRTVQISGDFSDLNDNRATAVPFTTQFDQSNSIDIPAGQTRSLSLSATLNASQYKLWHFDHPNLYRSNVQISPGNYRVSDRVGIRKIELRGTDFVLNGEKVRLNGYNRVSDDRAHGSVEPLHVIRRDMDRMKAAGANLSRIMHYGQHPALLDYADEKGMLLTVEVPVWGKKADLSIASNAQVYKDIDELLQRDWNHASIFAWSVANEIKSSNDTGRTFVRTMMDYIRNQHDTTRFLTFSTNNDVVPAEASQYTDFVSRNSYQNFEKKSLQSHKSFPNKPVFISEYSPDGFVYPTSRERLNHTTGADGIIKKYQKQPWVMGTSVWAYNDYRSTYRGTSTNGFRGWGLQNAWGDLKNAYFQMQKAMSAVQGLTAVSTDTGTQVTFNAKSLEELPAFALKGYKIVVQGIDKKGQVVGGKVENLQDIIPGSGQYNINIQWHKNGLNLVTERVSLLTPTGYEVDVTRVPVAKPSTPYVRQIIASSNSIRVIFDHVSGANQYELSLIDGNLLDGKLKESTVHVTTKQETFLEISGLKPNQPYTFRLKATNSVGATQSKITTHTLVTKTEMAPIIQAAIPVSNDLMVGFIGGELQTSWDIEVASASDEHIIKRQNTTVKGASRVRGLPTNIKQKVRVRGVNESGDKTVWSQWLYFTIADKNTKPQPPELKGVLAGENAVALVISPHPQAEYYTVKLEGNNHEVIKKLKFSAVDLLLIDGLVDTKIDKISISVTTPTGTSDFAPTSWGQSL
ncbi:hypothetical protein KO525_05250 [Psychrosphaera sp. B3R10]|uniref:glycoside hydrolase family 2 TIM barrel-domain containing protein n=1 Tax=unclassified Psychrosphaera TaxID=2641570 RepID=UPI001C09128C|nr:MULTISPECIES: glycoside hydrolase family 2 TIM barrel-domain containing protein [unclassified Psychrosphaera]MBU2882783.1 hypothetical protein [Psychrosphaera sp. I2R16]MBU2988783.1 hypothetical protein [Psychrosphaera sp. B3R10]